jgi:hypothetical protein
MTKASNAISESEKYSIKGLKTMQGSDGLVVSCNLYYEKKKIATVFDGGYGGELEIDFKQGEWKKFDNFIEDYPEQPRPPVTEEWDIEFEKEHYPSGFEKLTREDFTNKLITRELRSKDLKRILKKKVLCINKKNQMIQFGWKGNPVIIQRHIDYIKYKNKDIVTVLNELPSFKQALDVYELH